jgi:hypothetical protein
MIRLQRFREALALALLVVLPFHAFLVTVGTKLLLGPGHPPMVEIALWKEALLGVVLLLACAEGRVLRGKWKIDIVDLLMVCLIALSIVITLVTHGDWQLYLLGFKYDFLPLAAFLILLRVPWSLSFWSRAERILLTVGGIVAAYGVLTLFLPFGFFRTLGYSDALSLYLPQGPLTSFQYISGTGIPRIQSTMSGPNQLGTWLLIPLSMCIARLARDKVPGARPVLSFSLGFLILGLVSALLFTFSRSAWIAATIIAIVGCFWMVPRAHVTRTLVGGAALVAVIAVAGTVLAPHIFLRSISLAHHIERPREAIRVMAEYPLGLGLGAAGPAAHRSHDPCVFLPAGSDPTWARGNPWLCVFVGDQQVLPEDRACDCPFLPENWYLQVGIELGVLGMLLFIALIILLLGKLYRAASSWSAGARRTTNDELPIFLAFLGISIAALFLHAWEDSAVAYTAWVLLASSRR